MNDIEAVSRTVYGEARGEPFAGKLAVAWVIKNRASKGGWWGSTPSTVCLKPYQFSCWNANDPNRRKIESVKPDNEGFRQSVLAAALVLGDMEPDPTDGATHYHVADLDPKWAAGKEPVKKIGNHVFYKDID